MSLYKLTSPALGTKRKSNRSIREEEKKKHGE